MIARKEQLLLDEMQIFCSRAVSPMKLAIGIAADLSSQERLVAYENVVEFMLIRIKQLDKALQSLTPGGSEYVANPELCVERAKETRDRYREMWIAERNRRARFEKEAKDLKKLLELETDNRIEMQRRIQGMVKVDP